MIRLGQYQPADTVIHRLDPRTKVLAVVALGVAVLSSTSYDILLTSACLAALLGLVRMTPSDAAGALRPVAIFIAILFLVHLLFTDGEPLPPLPGFVTKEGLLRALQVAWQFAGLILAAAVLTRSTSPPELVSAIERLLRPFSRLGLPSQDLALMIAMALRLMSLLVAEYDRIRIAQLARGADFADGPLRLRARTVATLASALVMAAFRRGDELAEAMEARGYHRGPRTTLRELAFSRSDLAAFAALILLTGATWLL